MDTLNDNELLIIFKQLNLNERVHLRLVSKRFKSLLDAIKITKLIIYHEMPALPDRLTYTDEPFDIQDMVEVYDLNKFFNNPTILDQLEPIRQLVIEGRKVESEIDLKIGFKKLNYLRLRSVMFTNSSLLQSTELEYLMLEVAFFQPNLNELDKIDFIRLPLVFYYQFNDLKSRKIKYLKLKLVVDEFAFLEYCVEHGLFNSLEQIDVPFSDFASLILLNDRCPTLKIVNYLVGTDNNAFQSVKKIEYPRQQLRDDLSVYLFGTYESHIQVTCYKFKVS